MPKQYTKARFWKCALQVNPASYIAYRGEDHGLTEEQYNQELLKIAKENDIKVIGVANHGNVDEVDAIRTLMNANGIIVFPGFEIASSEKAHFVCLFPENTTITKLNRYLGSLELLNPEDGVRPSRLSAEQLLKKVEEDFNGFAYAAHCVDDNGVLSRKLNHVWQNPLLKAAQIPGALDDLKNETGSGYRQILLNKTPAYQRELPVAIINAKDVARPQDLENPKASCLIKMTNPGFDSFKLAFQDPESRVRLNSDVIEKHYSRIETLQVMGGYLDGLSIEFSEHLNAVIGGRGTGKSTLLECIRYALELEPISKNASKQHHGIIKENLGRSKARIELKIRSSKMNGKEFTIARRYGESASIKDESGTISPFTPADLLPEIELYGQNEIYEIAQDANAQRKLLARFLESGQSSSEVKIRNILEALAENRVKLADALSNIASTEDQLSRLPKLEEQVNQFKSLGLEDKLKIIPLLETEKRLSKRISDEELAHLKAAFSAIQEVLPDTIFLSDTALKNLPHAEELEKIRIELDRLKRDTETILTQWQEKFTASKTAIDLLLESLNIGINSEEDKLETTFKGLPSSEGKSGREIGFEFQALLKEIEKIKPRQTIAKTQRTIVEELEQKRKNLLSELSKHRSARSSQFERSLKSLNKKLKGKLKLTVLPESDRTPVTEFLMQCHLDGVGEKRLAWINDQDDFSPVKLAEIIRQSQAEGLLSDLELSLLPGITPTVANALTKLTKLQVLQLEELELPDVIRIELNIAHEGAENFRLLNKLSTGQQCTAILHLLLLQNRDPLIMDQPEDNLDNAFIADRIVAELRSAKIARQFIFATHNANIPVFGDAEWIGVFEAHEGQSYMPAESQGAIDVPQVRDNAANILEGGKTAFNQRKAKYGF
ncbi:MAG: AAA family ATPase [Candidatus Polarisedimenticolaceae bacterium]|nr:AAA family ATPase [Candidatus Polarisedimenticolaceae bacterium]